MKHAFQIGRKSSTIREVPMHSEVAPSESPSLWKNRSQTSSRIRSFVKSRRITSEDAFGAGSSTGHNGSRPRLFTDTMGLAEQEDELQKRVLEVQLSMKSELGMIEIWVPLGRNPTGREKVSIYASPDYHECTRLLIVVSNRDPGVWSRDLMTRGMYEHGSMMTYLKRARRENYGVIILNVSGAVDMSKLFQISFKNGAAEEHLHIVWNNIIAPLKCDLYLLGYSRGGRYIKELIATIGSKETLEPRIKSIALIESSHMMTPDDDDFAKHIFSTRATTWVISSENAGVTIEDKFKYGCRCISAGPLQLFNPGSNSAWVINQVIGQVFASFEANFAGDFSASSSPSSSRYSSRDGESDKIDEIVSKVRNRLISEFGFQTLSVPLVKGTARSGQVVPVYVSKDYKTCSRLVILFSNTHMGVWSRSVAVDLADPAGTIISFVQEALRGKYGVIIANCQGAMECAQLSGVINTGAAIDNHLRYIWDDYVLANTADADVFLFGFSKGGQYIKRLLNYGRCYKYPDMIRAIAFVESSHLVDNRDQYEVRRLLARKGVAWKSSRENPGTKVEDHLKMHGCITISIGPLNAEENTAYSMPKALPMVFGSFAARLGPKIAASMPKSSASKCSICIKSLKIFASRARCSWCRNVCCRSEVLDVLEVKQARIRLCSVCKVLPLLLDEAPSRKQTPELSTDSTLQIGGGTGSCILQPGDTKSTPASLSDFEIIKLIGRGACGRVKLVRKVSGRDAGTLYAMKSLRKKRVADLGLIEATKLERRILSKANHPYICDLKYAFQNDAKLYLLLDYYPGGNLLELLRKVKRKDITHEQIRLYIAQISTALMHLHSQNIMYRDVKLENVLVDAEAHVALTDFGMSKDLDLVGSTRTSTVLGTFQMMAPDILQGKPYTKAVDWWALGCLMFEFIGGSLPFRGKSHAEIEHQIKNAPLEFNERWEDDDAKDFVSRLLERNVDMRIGSGPHGHDEIMDHPYFRDISWEALHHREVTFPGQEDFAKKYVHQLTTDDVMDIFMSSRNTPVDTPDNAAAEEFKSKFPEFDFVRDSLDGIQTIAADVGLSDSDFREHKETTQQLLQNARNDELESQEMPLVDVSSSESTTSETLELRATNNSSQTWAKRQRPQARSDSKEI